MSNLANFLSVSVQTLRCKDCFIAENPLHILSEQSISFLCLTNSCLYFLFLHFLRTHTISQYLNARKHLLSTSKYKVFSLCLFYFLFYFNTSNSPSHGKVATRISRNSSPVKDSASASLKSTLQSTALRLSEAATATGTASTHSSIGPNSAPSAANMPPFTSVCTTTNGYSIPLAFFSNGSASLDGYVGDNIYAMSPEIETYFTHDFRCCGMNLADLHECLRHYETYHIAVENDMGTAADGAETQPSVRTHQSTAGSGKRRPSTSIQPQKIFSASHRSPTHNESDDKESVALHTRIHPSDQPKNSHLNIGDLIARNSLAAKSFAKKRHLFLDIESNDDVNQDSVSAFDTTVIRNGSSSMLSNASSHCNLPPLSASVVGINHALGVSNGTYLGETFNNSALLGSNFTVGHQKQPQTASVSKSASAASKGGGYSTHTNNASNGLTPAELASDRKRAISTTMAANSLANIVASNASSQMSALPNLPSLVGGNMLPIDKADVSDDSGIDEDCDSDSSTAANSNMLMMKLNASGDSFCPSFLPQTKPYPCTVQGCTKSYKNPNGLKYHMLRGHRNPSNDAEKPYLCPVYGCGKRYKNANGLKYHIDHGHPNLEMSSKCL